MIRIANAPCSWGALEFELAGEVPAADRVLDEMAAAGYAATELGDWGFLPVEPAALGEALARRGLGLAGGFVPVALADRSAHREGRERAVRTARLMAAVDRDAVLVLSDDNGRDPARAGRAGRIRAEDGLDADSWRIFAGATDEIARAVTGETGLRLAFHHHCGGFVETPAEIDRLMELTDPAAVGLCLDTGHVTYGGGDPVAAAASHGERVRHVHFKDCDPAVAEAARRDQVDYLEAVRRGVFCELGAGVVDFTALLAQLRGRGYAGWIVVEQDVFPGMGRPLDSARRSRAYLRERGA
ncbi:MAG TPA: TIM barrel protein [Kofleriaceae bacterium]|nr:TIM barrel protein [Kofleriaceae bacterium]